MSQRQGLPDQDREDLVAYLDGELGEEAARSLEVKLNRDSKTRGEMEALKRTWEMLDYLPEPKASVTFSSQTLERVSALRPVTMQANQITHWQTWIFGLSWAAALVLAALVGYASARAFLTRTTPAQTAEDSLPADREAILVRDLRIIENKGLYDKIGDIHFLRSLDDPELFGDEG